MKSVVGTGAAAISAGVLFFLSNLFGEFLLPAEENGEITNLGLFLVYVAAWGFGALALMYALRGLHSLYRGRGDLTRAGSIAFRVAAAGATVQAVFAAVYFATAAATGDAADAAFFLFALGFLLLIGGSLGAGISMIRSAVQPRTAGLLLVLTAAAAIATVTIPEPIHDVALFLFASSVSALGLSLIWPVRSGSAAHNVLVGSSPRS